MFPNYRQSGSQNLMATSELFCNLRGVYTHAQCKFGKKHW